MRRGRPLLSSLPLIDSSFPRAALLLAALGASACNPKEMAVHTRAANEFACPSNQVEVRALGGSAFVATGCGQTATYVCQRENPRENYEKDTGIDKIFFSGDDESVSCMREGEVKDTGGGSASSPPASPVAGAGKGSAGVQCPAGSRWDGGRCVGEVAVTCPPGHRFEVNIGCVPGAAPGAAPAPAPAKSCPPRMAFVPGGTLPDLNGKPAAVRDLCVDLGEVTAADYGKCSSRGACSSEGLTCGGAAATFVGVERREHPVNCVSWGQAAVYCKAEGKRLPTDAEWLWVARGGGAGTPFPWGDAAPADRVCWSGASKRDGTCAAGSPPGDTTPQRILGLAGNVSEWTASEAGGSGRIVRGGSFQTQSGGSALLEALAVEVTARSPAIGFRCVASPE